MSSVRILFALDVEGWDEARKRWAIGVALPLVAADATRGEASLPWDQRDQWPAAALEAGERLRRFVADHDDDSSSLHTGAQAIEHEQTRQDFVAAAPLAYNVTLWEHDRHLANVRDRNLVIALRDHERALLTEAVGASRLVELSTMLVQAMRAGDQGSFAVQLGLESAGAVERQSLMELTRDEDPAVRATVTMHLPWLTDFDEPADDIVARLIELTSDPDLRVRDYACFVLGTMLRDTDSDAIREALYARLDDINTHARSEALVGLAYRRDRRILPYLQEALSRPNDDVWLLELKAAGALGDPALHPLVLNHVHGWSDPDSAQIADVVRRLTDPAGLGEDVYAGVARVDLEPAHGRDGDPWLPWWWLMLEAEDIAPHRADEFYDGVRRHLVHDPEALARFEGRI